MDILDIMLAKAMTPQGKTDSYVAKANKAAAKAAKAAQDAESAIANVTAAAEDITAAQEAAEQLLQDAQTALDTAQQAHGDLPTAYSTTGQNTDGYMTQKATTDALALKADASALAAKADASAVEAALAAKADSSTLAGKADASTLNSYATKTYVDQSIAAIPAGGGSGGGVSNLGSENAGKMVKVASDGNIAAASINETDVVELLLRSDALTDSGIVGLEIDYQNKSTSRLFDADGKNMGVDFDEYTMYGGRKLCNVADNGTINAFYGEQGYKEDGSNGQVMIYQPKFYYQRLPIKTNGTQYGKAMVKERILLSEKPQSGFKIHPLFINSDGEEVDYVLTPSYEGTISNNKLCSIAGAQPAANLNPILGEAAATARGTGWHMTTAQFESASQMLQIVEYGAMNSQNAVEKGICSITDDSVSNLSCTTGSTASIGNGTGHAASSTNKNGTYSVNGQRAVRYRGMENPWGNMWHTLANVIVSGNGSQRGGKPYICTNYNYSTSITNNYKAINFTLAASNGWISSMGYDATYDWLYMPIETSSNANSAAPVGDNLWVVNGLNGTKMAAVGGNWRHEESSGIFFYACDQDINAQLRSFGASLMFIPTKNEIYEANIAKWTTEMEG